MNKKFECLWLMCLIIVGQVKVDMGRHKELSSFRLLIPKIIYIEVNYINSLI